MNEILKMVIVTTVICIFSATLLGGLKVGLEDRIIKQEDLFVRGPTIHELLKNCPNDPLEDKIILKVDDKEISVYPWIENGIVRRVALEWAGSGGYGGDVVVMTAVDLESNRIYGVRVTQHKETPGVGTRVMKPSYLLVYEKLPIDSKIALSKDGGQIDAVSGATRTSTAVADGVQKIGSFVLKHKNEMINQVLANRNHQGS